MTETDQDRKIFILFFLKCILYFRSGANVSTLTAQVLKSPKWRRNRAIYLLEAVGSLGIQYKHRFFKKPEDNRQIPKHFSNA